MSREKLKQDASASVRTKSVHTNFDAHNLCIFAAQLPIYESPAPGNSPPNQQLMDFLPVWHAS
jgi:hypothetical protein